MSTDWTKWPQQPPVSCRTALASGSPPFGTSAVWLHHRTRELIEQIGPFMTRALREERAGLTPEQAANIMLQPVITAVFLEWVATQPQSKGGAELMRHFANTCASLVVHMTQTFQEQPTASGKPPLPN